MPDKLTQEELAQINALQDAYEQAQDALLEAEDALEASDVFQAREATYAALEKAEAMFLSFKNMVLAKYSVDAENDRIDKATGEISRGHRQQQTRRERIEAYKLDRQKMQYVRSAIRQSRNPNG